MFQSYIIKHNFKKINLLMDQFCQECEKAAINTCNGCKLSHRKGNVSPSYGAKIETEQGRLNTWAEVM